jgi:parvulin-like peptidyl-prolyl isomerase
MLYAVPIAAVLVIGAVLAGLRLRAHDSGSAAAPQPVAQVGSVVISSDLFDARLRSALTAIQQGGGPQSGSPQYGAFLQKLRAQVLQSLIVDARISIEAQYQHISASDSDVQAELDAAAQAVGGMDQLQTQQSEAGGSVAQLRDQIRARINEQRLEDLFAQQRAATIVADITSGNDFATLAMQLSDDDTSKAKGGDLGAISVDQLRAEAPAFAAAVNSLKVGAMTNPAVRDDAGYEILRLDASGPTSRSLHRILVAAPRPYTVKERPDWFTQSVLDAVAQYCDAGQIKVFLDPSLQPCNAPIHSSPTPAASPAASPAATPSPTAAFSPHP